MTAYPEIVDVERVFRQAANGSALSPTGNGRDVNDGDVGPTWWVVAADGSTSAVNPLSNNEPLPRFVALGSFGLLSADVQAILSDASRWCLLIAVSALGARTSLQALTSVGASPMIAIVSQTLLLAIFVYVMLVTA